MVTCIRQARIRLINDITKTTICLKITVLERCQSIKTFKNSRGIALKHLNVTTGVLECQHPSGARGEMRLYIVLTAFQYSRPLHLNQRCLWFARMHGQWFEAAFRKLRKPETLGIVRKTRKVILKKSRGSPPSWAENQDIALVKKRKTLGKGSINFDVFQTCFVLFHSLPDFRRLAVINHSFRGHG